MDERILNAALMHHERCDGSGYPNGLKADEIDDFAKIVGIADCYDALTSARVYREPHCPFEVFRMLRGRSMRSLIRIIWQYSWRVLQRFILAARWFSRIISCALIVDTNPMDQSNPIVKINGLIVNLAMVQELDVKEIC